MNLGNQVACTIHSMRKQRGWTQKELANRCHYSRTYIGKIERGQKTPSLEALNRLADALGVDIVDLLDNSRITNSPAKQNSLKHMYLIGTTDQIACIQDCKPLPKQAGLPVPDIGEPLWSLPFLTPRAFATLREAFVDVVKGYNHTIHLHDSSSEHGCELTLSSLPENGTDECVSFTLIWPDNQYFNGWQYNDAEVVV